MQHAAKSTVGKKYIHGIGMGISVMNDNRLVQRKRQLQLVYKQLLLLCLSAVIPVIVKTYLAYCNTLFMGGQLSYNIYVTGLKACKLSGMDAYGGIYIIIAFRNLNSLPAAFHIAAGQHHQFNPLLGQAVQKLFPVLVKSSVIIMCMSIKVHGCTSNLFNDTLLCPLLQGFPLTLIPVKCRILKDFRPREDNMSEKKKRGKLLPVIIIAVVIAAALGLFLLQPKAEPLPQLESILVTSEGLASINAETVHPSIAECFRESFSLSVDSEIKQSFRSAEAVIGIKYLDAEALSAGLAPEMQELLRTYVESAARPEEIYSDDKAFLPEILERAYTEALDARITDAEKYCRTSDINARLKYSGGSWSMTNADELMNYSLSFCADMPGYEQAVAQLEYIDFVYKLPDWTSPGPKADPACYGESDDPAEILALLESDRAQKLIGAQELDFDADKDFIPGTKIRYYLDDSILTIVWQEVEHGAVGTFAETFIADASQLRRKLADDCFGGQTFYYPTQFAAQTNAVLALSGDFYDLPARVYGLYVYNGQLMRSCLSAGQSCLITDKGEMLFSYENQFASEEDAQKYIDENSVMFSLSFGPVLVDNGVDVTPYDYPIGEIRDTYARCAIGQLGERHYLNMTINCLSPDYYVYVTLRQAADSMIEHGCYNAYTLDGGQTGSIVLGGELINPVQFGAERAQSDIFYFATAIPNNK